MADTPLPDARPSPPGRPARRAVTDELGRARTLAHGPEQWEPFGSGPRLVVLGLGPDPAEAARRVEGMDAPGGVSYLECPAFATQMDDAWRTAIPGGWTPHPPDGLSPDALRHCRFLAYRPAARLFPSFWGPLLARCRLAALAEAPPPPVPEVWLPIRERGLLARELADAFQACGLEVRTIAADQAHAAIPSLLRHSRPQLLFSVNFAGLDPYGEACELLAAGGVPVAAWCVDNPWHLLSAVKGPWWRKTHLFVTDASFLPGLRAHGAQRAHHLPLAAWPGFASQARPLPELAGRLVFVGRSAFPGKGGFFAGMSPPPGLSAQAQDLLADGGRPDFHWWAQRLGIAALWPGSDARRAGLGAEESGKAWRALCLAAAADADLPLTVFGDEGWRAVPGLSDLRPPVDYYGPLASIYASTGEGGGAALNCTSPLLPAGLTQRHFDVWAAGGLLLTDATPGLSIFPAELTREVTFRRPADLPTLFRRFAADDGLRRQVAAAWRRLIMDEHTYARRIESVLNAVGTPGDH